MQNLSFLWMLFTESNYYYLIIKHTQRCTITDVPRLCFIKSDEYQPQDSTNDIFTYVSRIYTLCLLIVMFTTII